MLRNSRLKLEKKIFLSIFIVPIDQTPGISILYIFVDIQVNVQHIIDTLKHHFTAESKLALVSTIQFVRTLQVKFFLKKKNGILLQFEY